MSGPPIDEQEFMRWYDDLSDALFRHSYFRVFERERAKDLVQETFTRTWDYLSRGKQIENMRAFLYRVLNNLIIDESRKHRPFSLDALAEQGFDPGEDPKDKLTDQIQAKEMIRILGRLRSDQRELIVMRYVDGFGPKEIAETLGVRENAVSVRLHRAMNDFRKLVDHHEQ